MVPTLGVERVYVLPPLFLPRSRAVDSPPDADLPKCFLNQVRALKTLVELPVGVDKAKVALICALRPARTAVDLSGSLARLSGRERGAIDALAPAIERERVITLVDKVPRRKRRLGRELWVERGKVEFELGTIV